MPPKRTKTFLIKNQKKMIASRLMQISLKVDDYIYKHKPITVKSAAMFIKEVTGYRDKCFEDKRTLQVIEKLNRCMKGIIEEQEQLLPSCRAASDDVTLVDVDAILAASTDDDLTQLTEEINVNNILKSTKNDIDVIDGDDDGSGINKDSNDNGKDKVELGNKDNRNIDNRHCKYNLQRGISNLSITGEDDPLSTEPFNPGDYSQSILNDFDNSNNIDKDKGGNTNKILFSQDVEEVIQPATITKESRNARAVANVTPTIIQNAGQIKRYNILKASNNTSIPLNLTAPRTRNKCKVNENDTKEKVQKKRVRKSATKCEKKDGKPNNQASVRKNKRTNIETVRQNDITKITERKPVTSKKLFKGNVSNPDAPHQNKTPAVAETQSKQRLGNEKPTYKPIYNNDVENDLSWIENIRYVREITQEENIPAYFEDTFWQNYTLPNYWNNDDFLYT